INNCPPPNRHFLPLKSNKRKNQRILQAFYRQFIGSVCIRGRTYCSPFHQHVHPWQGLPGDSISNRTTNLLLKLYFSQNWILWKQHKGLLVNLIIGEAEFS